MLALCAVQCNPLNIAGTAWLGRHSRVFKLLTLNINNTKGDDTFESLLFRLF